MNKYLVLPILVALASCDKDDESTSSKPLEINGTYKIHHYEYKSKNYNVVGCDVGDKILINADKTGVFENSELNDATQACYLLESLAGNWEIKSQEGVLNLKYNKNGVQQTRTFTISGISDTEIRIENSSKNIDGIPGNDDVIEVWTKQF